MSYVELHFPFTGRTLTTDHGYALFGAISRIIPEVHTADWLAVSTLKGAARGDGSLQLDTTSTLKVRLPQDRVPLLLKLAGKRLDLDGHAVRLGAPQDLPAEGFSTAANFRLWDECLWRVPQLKL